MAADLTIADVRVRILSAPVEAEVVMSFGALAARSMALVEVESASGLVGYGESWINWPPWAGIERRATFEHGIAPLLLGEDARAIATLHSRMLARLEPLGRQWGAPGPIMQAISGADLALWDLVGTASGSSAAELLGGRVRDRVAVYASGIGPDRVPEMARRCAEQGFTAVKLRLGFSPDVDEANVRAAREAVGDEVELMVDANQGWTLDEALAMAPLLRECRVTWVEEPIRGGGLADLEAFHERSGLGVAAGENLYGSAGFLPTLGSDGVGLLQPDVSKVGGLTEAVSICRSAERLGRPVAPHLYGGAIAYAATLQLAACCPAVRLVEYDVRTNPLRDALLERHPAPVDGTVAIPSGPGLGVTLALDAVAALDTRGGLTSD
jgi:L-alanine-DL-glutamate epimerase-like enolase superfamily enzyme